MNEYIESLKSTFMKYTAFDGRADKKEFTIWMVSLIIFNVIISGLGEIAFGFIGLSTLVSLIVILPTIAVTIRRLRDAGQNPLLTLLYLIPVLGFIILLIIGVTSESKFGGNFTPPNQNIQSNTGNNYQNNSSQGPLY